MDSRELKRRHETAAVDAFVNWLNQTLGSNWVVVARPDPPDAIITDADATSWVEHADLYRSGDRSETSRVIGNHIPHSGPIDDPDRRTAERLVAILTEKLSKESYRSTYDKHGPGFLVISERDNLFDPTTVVEIDRTLKEVRMVGDKGYFRKIYLAIRAGPGIEYREITYRQRDDD